MQPDTLTFERTIGGHDKNKREDGSDWIEDVCVTLSRGDITKRDAILWGYTLAECGPYLRACIRDITFREAVLAFLGVKDDRHAGKEDTEHRVPTGKIGEYCKGKDVDECRTYWGKEVMARICATCPN